MDRFIVMLTVKIDEEKAHLKSNMDRFIVQDLFQARCLQKYLKSNMDRFIGQNQNGINRLNLI